MNLLNCWNLSGGRNRKVVKCARNKLFAEKALLARELQSADSKCHCCHHVYGNVSSFMKSSSLLPGPSRGNFLIILRFYSLSSSCDYLYPNSQALIKSTFSFKWSKAINNYFMFIFFSQKRYWALCFKFIHTINVLFAYVNLIRIFNYILTSPSCLSQTIPRDWTLNSAKDKRTRDTIRSWIHLWIIQNCVEPKPKTWIG